METQSNRFDYIILLKQVKTRVALAQKKAIYAANDEMLSMYWDIGKILSESQKQIGWGHNALERLANDLKNEYPTVKGFSVRNCQFMIQFYNEYNQRLTNTKQAVSHLAQPDITLPVRQLSWSHNIILMQKIKDIKARHWYMIQCLKNGWGRDTLIEMIKKDYYSSCGALANNFHQTLPEVQAKQVQETLKDPYIFDMLTFTEEYNERDVELGLIKHIEKFLLELGAGFAFLGRQYHIEVSNHDFYIDLLMYHTFLHCYVVIELKKGDFQPEYAGKLNFYCSAVDDTLRHPGDNPTIGLLLCQTKDKVMAEYALRDIHKPIGISEYELAQAFPTDFQAGLPSIEEIEKKLSEEMNQEKLY